MSIEDLFSQAWEVYKKRIGTLIAINLISGFGALAGGLMFAGVGFMLALLLPEARTPLIISGITTGVIFAMIIIPWGMAAGVYATVDSDLGVQDAFKKGWERICAFVWLYSLAGYLITGGFLLLIVPGIIFLVWFGLSQFILASEDLRGMKALQKSREYVRGHWFDAFLRLFLIWIASAIAGGIPLLGLLIAIAFMPYMMIYLNLLYEDLKKVKGEIALQPSTCSSCGLFAAGSLGYLVVPLILIMVMGAAIGLFVAYLKSLMASNLAIPI